MGKDDELGALISEKELLENEIHLLDEKNNALKTSMLAFVEEILEDLHRSNSGNINHYCFFTFLSFEGMVTYSSLSTCLCFFLFLFVGWIILGLSMSLYDIFVCKHDFTAHFLLFSVYLYMYCFFSY